MRPINAHASVGVVGGGIAGAALATVLARAGVSVAVLERQTVYRDRVRGEYMPPWGVVEAKRLDLCSVFERAGAIFPRWSVPYDELREPEAAQAARHDMSAVLPDVAPLCASHPGACQALIEAAERAGARVFRGVDRVRITGGVEPEIRFTLNGFEHQLNTRLIVGADGRNSGVRSQAGIPLHRAQPTHLVVGLLVDGVPAWPQDSYSIGTQGDVMFFVFPQGGERLRLYFCTALDQRDRFAGADGPVKFIETFRSLTCMPLGEAIASATPIGPCATLTGEDTWTDEPFIEGMVLVGDAAGYNDPIMGQGLSLALRDVRLVSELLLANDDWSPATLDPYAKERRERMRRVRFTAALYAALASEFGPDAAARRARFRQRVSEGNDPELKFALAAASIGQDRVAAFAFEESMRAKVLR